MAANRGKRLRRAKRVSRSGPRLFRSGSILRRFRPGLDPLFSRNSLIYYEKLAQKSSFVVKSRQNQLATIRNKRIIVLSSASARDLDCEHIKNIAMPDPSFKPVMAVL